MPGFTGGRAVLSIALFRSRKHSHARRKTRQCVYQAAAAAGGIGSHGYSTRALTGHPGQLLPVRPLSRDQTIRLSIEVPNRTLVQNVLDYEPRKQRRGPSWGNKGPAAVVGGGRPGAKKGLANKRIRSGCWLRWVVSSRRPVRCEAANRAVPTTSPHEEGLQRLRPPQRPGVGAPVSGSFRHTVYQPCRSAVSRLLLISALHNAVHEPHLPRLSSANPSQPCTHICRPPQ